MSQRLRVLLVSHLYPQGESSTYGIFVAEQARALAKLADVTVVVGRFGGQETTERLSSAGLRVVEVPLPGFGRLPSGITMARAVAPYARHVRRIAGTGSSRFDICHAHFGFPDGYVGVRHALREGLPSVVTLHGDDFNRQIVRPFVGPVIAKTLLRANRVVCVSPAMVAPLLRRSAEAPDRIAFIPNGYDSNDISAHTDRTPRYFLFVGGLHERKNPETLIRAYGSVADRTTHDLVIVGDGPLRERLPRVVHELGLEDRVRLEGPQPHSRLDGYLAEAAALVLPSASEGMPIVVNEALASGTPVIASRLPGTEAQVKDARFGVLIQPGDADDLARALLTVNDGTWDYAAIARESGVIDWDEYAGILIDMYRDILAQRSGT